jgi:hypothetical protein
MADIHIEFVSSALLKKQSDSKLEYILDHIRDDSILVLEDPLTSKEEKDLIRETMKLVDKKFPGIEISTLGREADGFKSSLIKLLGGTRPGLTVIGPSKLIRQIKKDPNTIHLFARSTK